MTFETMKMQAKYKAGFDSKQSKSLVEGHQGSQSELASKADLKETSETLQSEITKQGQESAEAISDLKVAVALLWWTLGDTIRTCCGRVCQQEASH